MILSPSSGPDRSAVRSALNLYAPVQGEEFEKAAQNLVDLDSSDAAQTGAMKPRQPNGVFKQC